ncbi:hypothetical protein ACFL6U_03790 [Planctomycetota bacterium]
MDYKNLCEKIYRTWRNDPKKFSDFDSDFNMFSLPEPYFPLVEGNNQLVVLNNNPGDVLSFQYHTYILEHFDADVRYNDVACWLMERYTSKETIISVSAKARNWKIEKVASALGYDGVENVETFFLHSSSFNKKKFLRNYIDNGIVVEYRNALCSYLYDRPVVVVAAVGSGSNLSVEDVAGSPWLSYQASIVGLEFRKAKLTPVTTRGDKITSGIIRQGKKVLICNMGSNNIPVDAPAVLAGVKT